MRTLSVKKFDPDLAPLLLLAVVRLLIHLFTNGKYGFHRDELAMLNDARSLAWGYVAYPPLTPFIGRIELELFGTSLIGFRFFSALSQSIAMVIAGLMARELGGSRQAQMIAAAATGIGLLSLVQGALFQYVAFDFLWVVLLAYFVIRLLKADDPRWWIPIGAVIGIGMMTRYTMGVHVIGLVAATLFTPTREHLKSPWLWSGALLAFLIFLPNILWQIQNDFISLEFQSAIHARDVRIGRADGYLPEQLIMANPFVLWIWIAGLIYYFRDSTYRMIAWMYVVPFIVFLIMQGRGYYLAPAYPMLVAAGSVVIVRRIEAPEAKNPRRALILNWMGLALGFVVGACIMLPVVPVNSAAWNIAADLHDDFMEEIGWDELTAQVAQVYNALPADEKSRAGILTGNYGEAGAINLYGPQYDLPEVISPVDSFWLRGAPSESIDVLVVVGYPQGSAGRYFKSCQLAGAVTNRYNVANEESELKDIYVCRGLRQPWSELWVAMKSYQ
jgi:4-amino-4-deoxy-L-arabinose transferase-like glycosyltransferase